jgi:hypothetical protein
MSQVEDDASEIEQKVWGLMLAMAEGDEDRWDLLIGTTPNELKDGIIRALCVSSNSVLGDLVKTLHKVRNPHPYVLELLREQVQQAGQAPLT